MAGHKHLHYTTEPVLFELLEGLLHQNPEELVPIFVWRRGKAGQPVLSMASDMLQNGASTSGSSIASEEEAKLGEALHIRGLLHQNTEEMTSIVRALNGEYIEPQAGGDLLRDGAGVLPTGQQGIASLPSKFSKPSLWFAVIQPKLELFFWQ